MNKDTKVQRRKVADGRGRSRKKYPVKQVIKPVEMKDVKSVESRQ